jgi:hypothetical protein
VRLVIGQRFDEEDVRVETGRDESRRDPPACGVKSSAIDGESMLVEKSLKAGRIGPALAKCATRTIARFGGDPRRAGDGQDAGFFEELSRRAAHEGLLVARMTIGSIEPTAEQRDKATEHLELTRAPHHEEIEGTVGSRRPATSHERYDGGQPRGGSDRRWPLPERVLAHPRLEKGSVMGLVPVYHTDLAKPLTFPYRLPSRRGGDGTFARGEILWGPFYGRCRRP